MPPRPSPSRRSSSSRRPSSPRRAARSASPSPSRSSSSSSSSSRSRRAAAPGRALASLARGVSAVARLLHELGQLKRVRRSGWWLAGVRDPESVAEHSFRVAAIAYCLASLEGADPGRAASLAIFHDAAECRVGDLHRLGKSYAPWRGVEDAVTRDQTEGLPAGLRAALRGLRRETTSRRSREARIAKDADLLECLLQAREYQAAGHRVERWIDSSLAGLKTSTGKALAREILATGPDRWWRDVLPPPGAAREGRREPPPPRRAPRPRRSPSR